MKSTYNVNSFVAGELTPRLDGRSDIEFYATGCKELTNFNIYVHGGATKRPGTYYIATAGDSTAAVRLIPFEYSTEQAYILEFGDEYMRVYKDGGQVLDSPGGSPYEIETPFAAEDLPLLKFSQTADTMYIVHPGYKPQVLTREDHDDWTMEDVDFYGGPFLDENTSDITITASATTGNITLTTSSGFFNALHVGAFFKLEGVKEETANITADDTWCTPLEANKGDIINASVGGNSGTWADTVTLQRSSDGGVTYVDYARFNTNGTLKVTEVEDGIKYRIGMKQGDHSAGTAKVYIQIMNYWGYAQVTGYTSSTSVSATVIKTLPHTSATEKWSEGAWSYYRGYPNAICFYEQRLIMGGTDYQPQTWWGSEVDDYVNFSEGTSLDDDAVDFTIASKDVNTIRWLLDGQVLMCGTQSGEWRLSSIDEALTPTTPYVARQSTHGSANLQALLIGNAVVYLQEKPSKVRAMTYDYRIDGYVSDEISIRAEHLLREGTVVDWDYAEKPDNVIYMVLDTGDMISCTYNVAQNTIAFSKFTTTSGSFESVACIPGDDRDEVWVVVNRNSDNGEKRMIEQFQTPFWEDQEDYIFMDSTLTYEGTPKTTISGLEHMEGNTLTVTVDGAVHPNVTVSGGAITLQDGYEGFGTTTKVHIGLPYTSTLTTMRLAPRNQLGMSLGKRQVIYDVNMLFNRTIGCKLGINEDNLETLKRFTYPTMNQAPDLFTGSVSKTFNAGWDNELYITLVSDQPLPFTILGISSTVVANTR